MRRIRLAITAVAILALSSVSAFADIADPIPAAREPWLIIVVAAILIIAGAILLYTVLKKRKQQAGGELASALGAAKEEFEEDAEAAGDAAQTLVSEAEQIIDEVEQK